MEEQEHEDAPLRIAILGAGPIGLEAALYARYLGYQVAVLEKAGVGGNVLRWGHVTMFSPFELNRSSLGVAALRAQSTDRELPANGAILSGRQYVDEYLLPLSQSDLLSGCVFTGVKVLAVGRDGILKSDLVDVNRSEYRFRILVNENGHENIVEADVVIDTTGVYDHPNYLGHGGIPALGELTHADAIDYHVPDVLGADRIRFADKLVLVVGGGYSAATSVIALRELRQAAPETRVTWMTRRALTDEEGPIRRWPNDRLPRRDQLAEQANVSCRVEGSAVTHWGQTSVLRISRQQDQFLVEHGGANTGETPFDAIIANVGFRPDDSIYAELQVHQSYVSQGPMQVSAALLEAGHADCLDQVSTGPDTLKNPEPDFYILGSKSYGRDSNFLLSLGFEQIRDAFTIIADRKELDLYKTMEHLAHS